MTNHPTGGDRRRPPEHHHHLSPSSSLKGCCCCLLLLLIFLALLAVALLLVLILVVRPKKPQFDLQRVDVQYLLIVPNAIGLDAGIISPPPSPPASAAAYLSLNITLLFSAVNPNRVGIRYEASNICVLYRGVPLGTAAVEGFEQPAHSFRIVESRVSVSRFNVVQADAVELVRDATVNDAVELRVAADVGARIRVLGRTSPRVQVSVDCVVVISPRKQSLTYKKCGVDGLNF